MNSKESNALAYKLGLSEDSIEQGYEDYIYETSTGEEYIVCDSDKARELAEEDINSLIDEEGLNVFTPSFQQWIIDYALNEDYLEKVMQEQIEEHMEEMSNDSSDKFDNMQIEVLFDEDLLSDDDFELDSEGKVDYNSLKDTVDLDALKSKYVNELVESQSALDWLEDQFGSGSELFDSIQDYFGPIEEVVDIDKVVDKCIEMDGIAHSLASYDGEEISLGDDLFAYRIN